MISTMCLDFLFKQNYVWSFSSINLAPLKKCYIYCSSLKLYYF